MASHAISVEREQGERGPQQRNDDRQRAEGGRDPEPHRVPTARERGREDDGERLHHLDRARQKSRRDEDRAAHPSKAMAPCGVARNLFYS